MFCSGKIPETIPNSSIIPAITRETQTLWLKISKNSPFEKIWYLKNLSPNCFGVFRGKRRIWQILRVVQVATPKKRLMPQHAFALCRLKIPLNLTWQPPRRMRTAPLRWIMQKESNEIRSSIPDAWTLLRMTSIYEEKTQQKSHKTNKQYENRVQCRTYNEENHRTRSIRRQSISNYKRKLSLITTSRIWTLHTITLNEAEQ